MNSTLTEQIGRGAAILSISKIVAKVVSFASYLLILYYLSLEEYGTIILLFSIMGPLTAISTFGISGVVVSEIARFIGEHRLKYVKKFIIGYVKAIFSTTLIIGIILIVAQKFLREKYGVFVDEYFLLLFILFVLQISQSLFSIIFRAHEKFQNAFLMSIIEAVTKFLVIVGFVFTIGLSITTVIASYAIAHAIVILFSSLKLSKTLCYFRNTPKIKKSILLTLLKRHGKWEVMNSIFMRFINPVTIWSVQIFLGVTSVAIFSLAMNLYSALSEMFSFSAIFLPIISRRIRDKRLTIFIIQKAKKYLFVLYFFVFLAAFFAGPFFIQLFIPKYFDAIPIFRLILFILFVNVLSFGQPVVLTALRKQKFIFVIGLFQKVSKIVLFVSLTYFFGLVGAAVAKILNPLFFTIIREWFLRKWYNFSTIGIKNFFSFDEYDKLFFKKTVLKVKGALKI